MPRTFAVSRVHWDEVGNACFVKDRCGIACAVYIGIKLEMPVSLKTASVMDLEGGGKIECDVHLDNCFICGSVIELF